MGPPGADSDANLPNCDMTRFVPAAESRLERSRTVTARGSGRFTRGRSCWPVSHFRKRASEFVG